MVKRCPLFFSLILTFNVILFSILSLSFPWYAIERNKIDVDGEVITLFYWDGIRTVDGYFNGSNIIYKGDNFKSDKFYYKDLGWDNIQRVFGITLGLLVIGVFTSCIAEISVFISLFTKNKRGAIIAGILQLLSSVCLLIGFFHFFRITKAFDKDDQFCITNDQNESIDKTYCNKFISKINFDSVHLNYAPFIGWIMCIIASFISIFAFIPSFASITKKKKYNNPSDYGSKFKNTKKYSQI